MAMRLASRQRTFSRRRIERAGGGEMLAILEQLAGARQGLGEAPGIGGMLEALRGPSEADQRLAAQAHFGGISRGISPVLQDALRAVGESSAARGVSRSTIAAAGSALAVPRVLNPALARGQQGFSQALMDLPFRRFGARSQAQGQAFGQTQAVLQRGLQERGMNVSTTQTSETFKRKRGLLGRLMGGALGLFTGGFGGALGGMAAKAIGGKLFGERSVGGGSEFLGPSGMCRAVS